MANHEENLKKINAELEQLSDEELEKVAGGKMFLNIHSKKIHHIRLGGHFVEAGSITKDEFAGPFIEK